MKTAAYIFLGIATAFSLAILLACSGIGRDRVWEIPQAPATQPTPHTEIFGVTPTSPLPTTQPAPSGKVIYNATTGQLTVEGNARAEIIRREETSHTGPSSSRSDSGTATGSGATATGQETKMEHKGDAPGINFGAPGAEGTGGASSGKAGATDTTSETKGLNHGALFLFGLGGVMLVAGCVAGTWGKQPLLGVGLALGGFLCIGCGTAADQSPVLIYACVGGIVVAVIIWQITTGKWGAEDKTALTAVVGEVEKQETIAPLTTGVIKEGVKTRAGKQADAVKAAVARAKARAKKAKAKAEAAGVV